jgi:amino-acid N-acetyltransferase
MSVRKAGISDVKAMQKLINSYAKKHKIIPRSLNDLYEHIRDFSVFESERGVVQGVCGLSVAWEDLAEIRSLAVSTRYKNRGIGTALVENALNEARELGIRKVFVLTYYPEYFSRFGFNEVDKASLPHKIWADCLNCHKFPDCDETAVQIKLKPKQT